MDLKNIQRKLQKLLALSASPNEAEALSAMKKCQTLMEKYNIRTIAVNKETNEANITTTCVKGYTKRHREWESKLAASICNCFDAQGVIQREVDGWNLMFISSASENEIIVGLYKRLRRIISKMSKIYSNDHEGSSVSLQRSYAFGMIETVHSRLITIYKDIPETRALVLVKKKAIDAKMEELFGKIATQRMQSPSNRDAYMQGAVDGKHVNLHKSVRGEKQRQMNT